MCAYNKSPKHQRGFDKEEVNITSKSRSHGVSLILQKLRVMYNLFKYDGKSSIQIKGARLATEDGMEQSLEVNFISYTCKIDIGSVLDGSKDIRECQ